MKSKGQVTLQRRVQSTNYTEHEYEYGILEKTPVQRMTYMG